MLDDPDADEPLDEASYFLLCSDHVLIVIVRMSTPGPSSNNQQCRQVQLPRLVCSFNLFIIY